MEIMNLLEIATARKYTFSKFISDILDFRKKFIL